MPPKELNFIVGLYINFSGLNVFWEGNNDDILLFFGGFRFLFRND